MGVSTIKTSCGFTAVEILIALLIVSFLAIASTNFLRSSSIRLADEQKISQNSESSILLQKKLMDDLKNIVSLNPACADNPPSTFISGACSELKVIAGITPLPASSREDLDELTDFLPSESVEAGASLSKSTDAIRLLLYDFTGSFNCKLNPRHTSTPNPSRSIGTGLGDERLWAHPQCASLLQVGSVYILTEEIEGIVFSNLFQITAMSTVNLPDSTQEIQIDTRSSSSLWNQRFGLGAYGYSSAARIYPVKIVEWAVSDSGGLWRREIRPSATDLTGKLAWNLVAEDIESMQFYYLTGSGSSFLTHHRQLSFNSDVDHNGTEDIRGLTPHLVIKGREATNSANAIFDNPHTETVENDRYPRSELSFFASIINE